MVERPFLSNLAQWIALFMLVATIIVFSTSPKAKNVWTTNELLQGSKNEKEITSEPEVSTK